MSKLSLLSRRAGARTDRPSAFLRAAERANLTTTGVGVLGAIVMGWIAARIVGARTMYLIVYAMALAVIFAWLISRRRLSMTVVRQGLPRRMRVGQMTKIELTMSAGRRTSMVLVNEQIDAHLGTNAQIAVASLSPGQEAVHSYAVRPDLRGVYSVGPVTATWSDPFGFTVHKQTLTDREEIIVHPQTELVRDSVLTRMWEDPPIRPPVSKPWPVGFEFYGMRDYVPGDDLRRVVWSVVAKTGKMMVRESEQGITDRVVIVIDTDREWHSPGETSETLETAIRAAASVGVRHLADGFSVSLYTCESQPLTNLRGGHAELQFLDEMARVQLGETPLQDIAHKLFDEAKARPHLFVATPHLSPREAQQLKLIADRGVGIVVALIDWEESDPASLSRAASLGCRVVRIPSGSSLGAVFSQRPGARVSAG